MKYIANAFSLNMLEQLSCSIHVKEIPVASAMTLAVDYASVVGHPDTAAVFSTVLRVPVSPNRATVALKPGDEVLVGQYRGPRMPEGCKTLPEGAKIDWCLVTIS